MKLNRSVAVLVALGVAPTTAAMAAVVEVEGGGLVYRAAPGETNAVVMNYPFSTGLTKEWWDYRSPLVAGPGCTGLGPVVCPIGPATVYLGDRDDVAFVDSVGGGDNTVHGEAGDDDFTVGGPTQGHGYGGPGDDTIRFAVGGDATGEGGAGNDRLNTGGQLNDRFTGDGGDDLLVGSAMNNRLNGGTGHDALVLRAFADATLTGDAGNDVLVVDTTSGRRAAVLDGGDGHDIIQEGTTVATVDGGAGNDQIDVSGGGTGPDTVVCGAGTDKVWADPDDVVDASCEQRTSGPAPVFDRVQTALADAAALAAHRANPHAGLVDPLGTDVVGPGISELHASLPEAYRAIATAGATVSRVALRTGPGTSATRLLIGIYDDDDGRPGALLTSGELSSPLPSAWNTVTFAPVALAPGAPYWIGVMGTGGPLQLANHDGGTGDQPSETGRFSAGDDTTELPPSWRRLTRYPRDGMLSAYAF